MKYLNEHDRKYLEALDALISIAAASTLPCPYPKNRLEALRRARALFWETRPESAPEVATIPTSAYLAGIKAAQKSRTPANPYEPCSEDYDSFDSGAWAAVTWDKKPRNSLLATFLLSSIGMAFLFGTAIDEIALMLAGWM